MTMIVSRIATLLAALLFSTTVLASEAGPAGGEPPSDKQLQKFAVAMNEVMAIQRSYAARMQSQDVEQDMGQLQQQAQVEMVEAIEKRGLEVDEYNQIAMHVQQDPDLQQKVMDLQ